MSEKVDNKTFNMVPKDDKLKKFGRILGRTIGIIVLGFLLISISPKNAVRLSMMLNGVSPVTALKTNPQYNASDSRTTRGDIYLIPYKEAFEPAVGSNGDKVNSFRSFKILFIFHLAIPVYPYGG